MSIKKKAVSGFLWTFVDVFFSKGIGLISSIVMARILLPEDFGLLGMVYIFTALSSSLIDSGLTSSLTRSNEVNTRDFDTIFWANIFFAIFFYFILFSIAPLISQFYNEPRLILLIRVYSLILLISGLTAVQNTIHIKKLDFKRLTYLNLPGAILGGAIGIFLAYINYSYWSIVLMQLITQTIFVILLWFTSDYKPSFYFSRKLFQKHFNFGYKLTLVTVLYTLFDNIYNIIIGKNFSAAILGQYDRAKTLNNYPVSNINTIVTRVSYPLFSSMQNNKEMLFYAYKRINSVTFFIVFPIMLLLVIIAEPLIINLLGTKWLLAVTFFKILCLAGIFNPINSFNMNLLKVYGRSDLLLKNEIIKKIILIALVFIAIPYGVDFIVWSFVVFSIIAIFINSFYTKLFINYSLFSQLKDNFMTVISGLITFCFTMLLFNESIKLNNLYYIGFISIFYIFVYLILNYVLGNHVFKYLLKNIKNK